MTDHPDDSPTGDAPGAEDSSSSPAENESAERPSTPPDSPDASAESEPLPHDGDGDGEEDGHDGTRTVMLGTPLETDKGGEPEDDSPGWDGPDGSVGPGSSDKRTDETLVDNDAPTAEEIAMFAETLILEPMKDGTARRMPPGRTTIFDPPDSSGPPATIDEASIFGKTTIVDPADPLGAGVLEDVDLDNYDDTVIGAPPPPDMRSRPDAWNDSQALEEIGNDTVVELPGPLSSDIDGEEEDLFESSKVIVPKKDSPGASSDDFFDNFTVSTAPKKEEKSGEDFFDNFSVSTKPKEEKAPAGDDFFAAFTVTADLTASHRGYEYEEDEEDDEPEPLPDDLEAAAEALVIEGVGAIAVTSVGDDGSLDFLPAGEASKQLNPLSTEELIGAGSPHDSDDQRQLARLRATAMSNTEARQWDAADLVDWDVTSSGPADLDDQIGRAAAHLAPPPPPPATQFIEEHAFGRDTTVGINVYDDGPPFIMERVTARTRVLALATVAPQLDNRPGDPACGIDLMDDAPAWIPESSFGFGDGQNGDNDEAYRLDEDTTVTGELPPGWKAIIADLRAQGHETVIQAEGSSGTASTGFDEVARARDGIVRAAVLPGGDHAGNALEDTAVDDQSPELIPDDVRAGLHASAAEGESSTRLGEIDVNASTATDEPMAFTPLEEISWSRESEPGTSDATADSDAGSRTGYRDGATTGALTDKDGAPILEAADFNAASETQVWREVQSATSGVTDRMVQLERESELLRERYGQLLTSYERIRGAIRLAKTYQQQMLPEPPSSFDGLELNVLYKPAEHVSGDFYDFIKVGEPDQRRYAVTIGDISGHGIAPALIMTVCRKVLHVFLEQNCGPAEAIRRTNAIICPDLPAATFITAIVGVIDMDANTFTFVRAGHPAPMIFNPERGPDPMEPNPRGMAIGMDVGPVFNPAIEEQVIELQPNDLIVMFSDGVIELSNARKEQFGKARFVDVIREFGYGTVPFLMRKINNTVQSFRAGSNQDDDLSVVVIKVLSEKSAETVLKRSSGSHGGGV